MVDTSASTSTADCAEFNEEFIRNVRHLPIERLEQELEMLRQDKHPLLKDVLKKIEIEKVKQADRIGRHKNRAENQVRNDFESKRKEIEDEFNNRIAELQEEAKKRSEELDKSMSTEFNVIDINKPHVMPVIFETNKKTLRGRGGGQIIEVPTYLNANQSVRLPEVNYECAFDDTRIRTDIDSISKNTMDTRRRHLLNVSLQKPKLTVDTKSYKQGEDVYVSNRQYGEIHARIELISDKHVIFKGIQGWDTRQIIASLEDLEDNRMLVEIECRALNAAHEMLIQDFEPRDALIFLDGLSIFTEDHSDLISNKPTRLERIAHFMRGYRRHATELKPLIDFFTHNSQMHLADFLNDFIATAISNPEDLREFVISPIFQRQMLDRKLLLGNVPKHLSTFCRECYVDRVITKLEYLCDHDSFFLFLHGRAGSGKSVIAAQALAKSEKLIGVHYSSVVWLKDSGTTVKSTFDLFTDLLLMLKKARIVCDTDDSHSMPDFINRVLSRSEDDLLSFPSVENVTSVVLKKMIASALIDRPNTLFVFDDVVQEETIRWAQELRLRCLVTIRDLEITNVTSPMCEFVEITPMEPDECYNLLESYGMPIPNDEREEQIAIRAIELASGSPAVLMMMFKSCEPKTFEKMEQLTNRMESRGLTAIECITPYSYKSMPAALQRCVELLSDEDRSALAFAVVMPPGVDIPLKIWSCVIPVDICASEMDVLDEEVAERLKRLSKRGALMSGKRIPTLTFIIDHLIHLFLKHAVDIPTIKTGLLTLERGLVELGNNNSTTPERAQQHHFQKFRRPSLDLYAAEDVICPEDYPKFMQIHHSFYESLRKFVS